MKQISSSIDVCVISTVICTKSPKTNGCEKWENCNLNRAESRSERKSVYFEFDMHGLRKIGRLNWNLRSKKKFSTHTHAYTSTPIGLMTQNEKSKQIFSKLANTLLANQNLYAVRVFFSLLLSLPVYTHVHVCNKCMLFQWRTKWKSLIRHAR